ncbi:MAG: hypothetical protein FJ279_23005 [Planctomycetes bacterium]|nr:hypothetical protein [Planctomycetota bacterium]MBM4078963.1 hypothetical protein [Planctomycetota bacterium]MBM4083799.1 hypothetical protein [Planctomycetota bacterium]
MTYYGKVEGGKVVLPPEANLPDGIEVRVEPVDVPDSRKEFVAELLRIADSISGLPSDLAAQHDHYIHGTPKR